MTFTTSLGHFAGAAGSMAMTTTATADSSNRATVDLIGPSDLTGQARVTATVADTTVQTTIDFVRALPELVQPDKPALKASLQDSTTVTATLLRGSGKVTRGTVVSYRVVNADTGVDLGFLIRSVSPGDAEGKSQAVVIAGNTAFRGTATIRASADGIVGETNIAIIDP